MASIRWLGKQRAVGRVFTFGVNAYDTGTSYRLQAGSGRYIQQAGVGGNATTTAANWASALSNATDPEFLEFSFSASGANITATQTSSQAGKSSAFTASAVGGSGSVFAVANSTAPLSPSDTNDALNYDTGSLPTNGDTLTFDSGAAFPLLWNANALAAVQLDNLVVQSGFTDTPGQAGLPSIDRDGAAYAQWRPLNLAIGANNASIGDTAGLGGSPLFRWDSGSGNSAITVFSTGSSSDVNTPAFLWKGTGVNSLRVEGGSVGVALFGNEVANVPTLVVAGGSVLCGPGTIHGTVTQGDGSLDTANAITTVLQNGGTHTHRAGNITTANVNAGTLNLPLGANAVITNLTIGSGGTVDATLLTANLVVTNATIRSGGSLIDPLGRVSFTNPASLPDGLNSASITRGGPVSVQFS